MQRLSLQDLENYLVGAKILACGGGGSVAGARRLIDEVYEAGDDFTLVELQDVPDDELLFIVGVVGGGVSEAAQQAVAGLPRIKEDPLVKAVQVLMQTVGQEAFGLIASEIGPWNGVAPMYVATRLGKVVVDGDCCGRAKPEIAISTTNLAGLSITPLTIVSPFGDIMVLEQAMNDQRAEMIARHMAVASGGMVGVARCPCPGADYKRAAVEGSVSRCIQLGAAIKRAQDSKQDAVEAFLKVTSGFHLFSGRILRVERTDAGGFVTGTIEIEGSVTGEDVTRAKQHLRIWYKNEYLAVWLDGNPLASSPDLICVVDAETAEGLTPWEDELAQRRRVVVVGIPAVPHWRTKAGIELFGPAHFGLSMKYVPLEDRMKGFSRTKG